MFEWLLQYVKKLVIHSWHGATVLKRGVEIPQYHCALEGFTATIENFTDSDWASANDYAITIAKLQVKSMCATGWLIGSHRDMNATDLGSKIYASSENVKQFSISIKFQVICTQPGKQGQAERVVAAHIKTDFTKASLCSEMMFTILVIRVAIPLALRCILLLILPTSDHPYLPKR
jgi:hypothetical protein